MAITSEMTKINDRFFYFLKDKKQFNFFGEIQTDNEYLSGKVALTKFVIDDGDVLLYQSSLARYKPIGLNTYDQGLTFIGVYYSDIDTLVVTDHSHAIKGLKFTHHYKSYVTDLNDVEKRTREHFHETIARQILETCGNKYPHPSGSAQF
ncbi:hypothetical protein DH09_00685 (plasmid) [Bacillaceae bacterium JMAK1]|nr:hypothetical protein DH09_00685 [Bacillaceae bacterium JMAK1]